MCKDIQYHQKYNKVIKILNYNIGNHLPVKCLKLKIFWHSTSIKIKSRFYLPDGKKERKKLLFINLQIIILLLFKNY